MQLIPETYVYAVNYTPDAYGVKFLSSLALPLFFEGFTELGMPYSFSDFLGYIVSVNFCLEAFEHAMFSQPNNFDYDKK